MLVVLVVLMLLPTWSDGLLLTKCQLKSQLEAVLQGEFSEDLIAKLTCAVEHISGFNSSLETITDQFDPRTLMINPFLFNNDEDHAFGMGENTEVKVEPLNTPHEDNSVTGQGRKRRAAPSTDEGDASWMSRDDAGEGSEENQALDETISQATNQLSPDSTDVYYDTFEMLFGPTALLPEMTTEYTVVTGAPPETLYSVEYEERNSAPDSTDIPLDTYEMLSGPTELPPETKTPQIFYDTFEMLFGPTDLTPETTTEHIYSDSYEMLFGPKDNPMDGFLGTTGPPETKSRSKRSSGDPTTLYGIFQLSDIACNSGSSQSLNLCRLDCSALTDDDIADDIACLKTLNMMPLMSTQECADTANYFTECG